MGFISSNVKLNGLVLSPPTLSTHDSPSPLSQCPNRATLIPNSNCQQIISSTSFPSLLLLGDLFPLLRQFMQQRSTAKVNDHASSNTSRVYWPPSFKTPWKSEDATGTRLFAFSRLKVDDDDKPFRNQTNTHPTQADSAPSLPPIH
ncbi:hypothetical protein D9758_015450 [Tetrapyrgos nigripes]|uniref:Uncharacterized protein n=1 Tax=Tetrapyrgos nigripes TaxID=182062 RepID=A0A8H5CLR9_9AGAR|nr:hypothetical protein D9758_015450 [Tetrapyrgos nigripes]